MSAQVSRLVEATKVFADGAESVIAVRGAAFSVDAGEMVGVVGPSGSGKTTLLNLIGTIESPTSGSVFFQGLDVAQLRPGEKRSLRLTKVGFVFQQLRLIPTLSATENVELPMAILGKTAEEQRARALELIETIGLAGKAHRRPANLSVGEQQRVAVARAAANDPVLLLADEPTSYLDSANADRVLDLLNFLRRKLGAAVVVSTHDPGLVSSFGRTYRIKDGVLEPR